MIKIIPYFFFDMISRIEKQNFIFIPHNYIFINLLWVIV